MKNPRVDVLKNTYIQNAAEQSFDLILGHALADGTEYGLDRESYERGFTDCAEWLTNKIDNVIARLTDDKEYIDWKLYLIQRLLHDLSNPKSK